MASRVAISKDLWPERLTGSAGVYPAILSLLAKWCPAQCSVSAVGWSRGARKPARWPGCRPHPACCRAGSPAASAIPRAPACLGRYAWTDKIGDPGSAREPRNCTRHRWPPAKQDAKKKVQSEQYSAKLTVTPTYSIQTHWKPGKAQRSPKRSRD